MINSSKAFILFILISISGVILVVTVQSFMSDRKKRINNWGRLKNTTDGVLAFVNVGHEHFESTLTQEKNSILRLGFGERFDYLLIKNDRAPEEPTILEDIRGNGPKATAYIAYAAKWLNWAESIELKIHEIWKDKPQISARADVVLVVSNNGTLKSLVLSNVLSQSQNNLPQDQQASFERSVKEAVYATFNKPFPFLDLTKADEVRLYGTFFSAIREMRQTHLAKVVAVPGSF